MTDTRLLVPVPEAARLLGIGETKAWELLREDHLKVRRIKGRTLVTMDSVRAVAEAGVPKAQAAREEGND